MTPKEKAHELINKMAISTSYGTNYTGGEDIPMYRNQYAKQCALIAVDEILATNPYKARNYWQEVKKEIEKL